MVKRGCVAAAAAYGGVAAVPGAPPKDCTKGPVAAGPHNFIASWQEKGLCLRCAKSCENANDLGGRGTSLVACPTGSVMVDNNRQLFIK